MNKRIERLIKLLKLIKNPGKTKTEKEVYRHYGYDANDAIDKQVPLESLEEEYWEDE